MSISNYTTYNSTSYTSNNKTNAVTTGYDEERDNYRTEHQHKMYFVLIDIKDKPFCRNCDKTIIKTVWSMRRSELTFCSEKCLDEYW